MPSNEFLVAKLVSHVPRENKGQKMSEEENVRNAKVVWLSSYTIRNFRH